MLSPRFSRHLLVGVLAMTSIAQAEVSAPSRRIVDRQPLAHVRAQAVTRLSLVNAKTGRVIPGYSDIQNGATIDLASLPTTKLNVRAQIGRRFRGGINFELNGANLGTDTRAPYLMRHTRRSAWTPSVGSYTIQATPRTTAGVGSLGEGGLELSLSFVQTTPNGDPTPTPSRAPGSNPNSPTPSPSSSASPSPSPSPSASPTPNATPPTQPIPLLAQWQSQMLSYGHTHCDAFSNTGVSFDTKLLATYYDAIWVYQQIYDYTLDPYWLGCVNAARNIYRDQYAAPNGGTVPGYWNFTHGLTQDFLRTGNTTSRAVAIQLAQNGAFMRDTTQAWETEDDLASREAAYAIMNYLNEETLGNPRRSRLGLVVSHAHGHLNQWFVSQTADYVRPFMLALTAHALISYDEQVGDASVLPALTHAADWIWTHTWLPNSKAFMYTDRNTSSGGQEAAPDLNMLIAPLFAWLYHQTGEQRFLDRFDAIFQGGVQHAWLVGGKQFNQNYRRMGDYMRLRTSAPLRKP